jgi:hypothetical protein
MYGPNYVKLSRLFAVQLFSMIIGHYAALPPVRSDPCWSHSHAITARLHLSRPHPGTATPTARDSNLGSGNHDMSRLPTSAYPSDAPIHGLADIHLAYSQQILVRYPRSSLPDHTRQHPRCALATQTSAVATTTCLDYLRLHTQAMRPSDGLADVRLAYSQRILGRAPSLLALRSHTATPTARDPKPTSAVWQWQPRHV